jgi:phosphate transport system substrate-binding protein
VTIVAGARPEQQTVQGTLQGSLKAIEIEAFGSKTAFEDLGADRCDIGMASRPIKPEEKDRLLALGDLTARGSENVLGLDGLAVVVNAANPVDVLTLDQIGRVFSGQITDWSGVGGSAGPIHVYARDDKSGTYDMFKSLVLKDQPLVGSARRYENSEKLSDDVAADPAGIGFIGMPFIRSARALKVSVPGAQPIRPNPLSVKTEDYPLSRRLFLYKPASPKNPLVTPFVTFALSDRGQALVKEMGFMDQTLSSKTPLEPAENVIQGPVPQEYATLVKGAERAPLNFRFRSGSAELDNKAFLDLGRLAQLMSQAEYQGRQILLLGFADSTGTQAANQRLSEERVRALERELQGEGIRQILTRGFGQELPVADNGTEEGRNKNRRVEVWVRR